MVGSDYIPPPKPGETPQEMVRRVTKAIALPRYKYQAFVRSPTLSTTTGFCTLLGLGNGQVVRCFYYPTGVLLAEVLDV